MPAAVFRDVRHPRLPGTLRRPGGVHRDHLDALSGQSQRTLEVERPEGCTAAHPEHECRSCGVERSDTLSLRLEVDSVVGQAAPVIYLPGENRGSGTDTRVVDAGKGPLGKHPRTLEIAAMFRSSPGGVQPAGARIVVFTQLGSALERSRSRRLT